LEKDKEKELLGYFLPAGTLEYFVITHANYLQIGREKWSSNSVTPALRQCG